MRSGGSVRTLWFLPCAGVAFQFTWFLSGEESGCGPGQTLQVTLVSGLCLCGEVTGICIPIQLVFLSLHTAGQPSAKALVCAIERSLLPHVL